MTPRPPTLPASEPDSHERLVGSLAALERFQREIHACEGREEILATTLAYLGDLLPIEVAGFFFPHPVELHFSLQTPLAPVPARTLSEAVDEAIDSGVFGWALKHPRPAARKSADGRILVLAALRARRHVLGMFAALFSPMAADRASASNTILGAYLACAADAIRSEELTAQLQEHNRHLDLAVRERTRELEETANQLRESQQLIAGAVKIAYLLSAPEDLEAALSSTASILGQRTRSDRILLVRNKEAALPGQEGAPPAIEWRPGGAPGAPDSPRPLPERWQRLLARGETFTAQAAELSGEERYWIVSQRAQTVLLLPLMAEEACWGHLRFDAFQGRRDWGLTELYLMVAISNNIGLALRREQQAGLLKLAKEAAEVANQAKDRFLATVSHELRTPLNAILGFTQVLRHNDALPARATTQVRTIHNAAEHLLALINDLLDMAKAQAGRLELLPAPVRLGPLVQETLDILQPKAQDKSLALSCQVEPGVPETCELDARRLRQILLNLLGNAIKFTAAGSVTLRVSRSDALIRFCVADTGCGIAQDEMPRLGQSFQQLGDPAHRAQGSGLGLAISRRIIQAMGGVWGVESQVGRGSSFWFDLPCAVSGAEVAGPAPLQASAPAEPAWQWPDTSRTRALRALAARGDMFGLQKEVEQWVAESPLPPPQAAKLLELARGFRVKTIQSLLNP